MIRPSARCIALFGLVACSTSSAPPPSTPVSTHTWEGVEISLPASFRIDTSPEELLASPIEDTRCGPPKVRIRWLPATASCEVPEPVHSLSGLRCEVDRRVRSLRQDCGPIAEISCEVSGEFEGAEPPSTCAEILGSAVLRGPPPALSASSGPQPDPATRWAIEGDPNQQPPQPLRVRGADEADERTVEAGDYSRADLGDSRDALIIVGGRHWSGDTISLLHRSESGWHQVFAHEHATALKRVATRSVEPATLLLYTDSGGSADSREVVCSVYTWDSGELRYGRSDRACTSVLPDQDLYPPAQEPHVDRSGPSDP